TEPLPTFEIPPPDPFKIAINHFEAESQQHKNLSSALTVEDNLLADIETPLEDPLSSSENFDLPQQQNIDDEPITSFNNEETPAQEDPIVDDNPFVTPFQQHQKTENELNSFQPVEIPPVTPFLDEIPTTKPSIIDDFTPIHESFSKDDVLAPEEEALMPRFLHQNAPKPVLTPSVPPVLAEKKPPIFPNSEELIPNTDHIDPLEEDEEIESMIQTIERTFESFNISMKVVDFSRGPSITRFELDPPSGLKLRTVRNLQDDIALQLGISNIRIISPVEGRSYIGIEVPNTLRRSFMLKQFIDDEGFTNSDAALPLILGMDVGGNKICSDLASLPHLLVAGTTGSGKSVYINALIAGLLFKRSSDDLKFIMIDPKMVELELYNGIPHLLAPIITKPEEAMAALEWAVQEMDRRYRLLSEMGVRNIKEYEALVKKSDAEDTWEHLPYIVIIVDEFANLMLRAPKDTEKHISRLAAMARAVGMHLVVATQRPSVDVVTGVIKANFP
ncbi:MAG: DNA translocase FtsK, partial [Brevinema sp.]